MKHSPLANGLDTFLLLAATCSLGAAPANWPQFRGPNGSGVADDQDPPVQFDARTNLLWQATIPPGASSPCIWGDRIFLTAFDNNKLQTLCVRRADGQILWRKTVPVETLEIFQPQEGSPAAATPVTDGEISLVRIGTAAAA